MRDMSSLVAQVSAGPGGEAAAPDERAVVQSWLLHLHALVGGRASQEEVVQRVRLFAFVGRRFPTEAFCDDSLEHVAAASRFWPSYGELVERLEAWWAPRRQSLRIQREAERLRALPPPDLPAPPSEAERAEALAKFRAWSQEFQARAAAAAASEPPPRPLRDVSVRGRALWEWRNRRREAMRLPPLPEPASFDGYGA